MRQLTGDRGESGGALSILPSAQWVRAADLLRHAVETTEKEQSSAFICMDCQVGAIFFLAHSQDACLLLSAYALMIESSTKLADTST